MTPLGKEIKENSIDRIIEWQTLSICNLESTEFWNPTPHFNNWSTRCSQGSLNPPLAPLARSRLYSVMVVFFQCWANWRGILVLAPNSKQHSWAEHRDRTGQICPFHLLCWMDHQQFSVCIMNVKVLVHNGVLNTPAVVPSSLLIPSTAGGTQHYQTKIKTKTKQTTRTTTKNRKNNFTIPNFTHPLSLYI